MDIKELNEAIGRALNEISDAPVNAVADKRKDAFEKNRADFYIGKDNADELRKSKFALDKNTYLTNKREFRKNYDGRYLKVEYDDDQAVYDMYVEDQLALGRTIEDIEAEDPKCYTVWVMGADKQTLENDKDGKPITFNYASVWKADEMSSEEIIAETQKQLGKELVPDGIKLVWNNDESVADKENADSDIRSEKNFIFNARRLHDDVTKYGYSEYSRKVRKLCKFYGKTIDDYDKVVLNRES